MKMVKLRITALCLALLLLLCACANGVGKTQKEADAASLPEADMAESMEETYRQYDSSYSSDTFTVRTIDALAGRKDSFVIGADISLASAIAEAGGRYRDSSGAEAPICKILSASGVNAVRLRLFHDYTSPTGTPCGRLDTARVIAMIREAKAYSLQVILDLHYSDSWADPGHQSVPYAWKDFSFEEVKNAVYDYTAEVLHAIRDEGLSVDFLQIGNEINNGFLFPHGQIDWNDREASFDRLAALLLQGSRAAREVFPECKIILHTANGLYRWVDGKEWGSAGLFFYQELEKRGVDYDIAGASFYVFEDDTPVSCISEIIDLYTDAIHKPVMIMETSYAYTYEWNDLTSNIFYTDKALPGYPVTFQGQTDLLLDIIEETASAKDCGGIGVCWWGGEWIPNTDKDMRTSWANQALFTYEGIATPTLSAFQKCLPALWEGKTSKR